MPGQPPNLFLPQGLLRSRANWPSSCLCDGEMEVWGWGMGGWGGEVGLGVWQMQVGKANDHCRHGVGL